MLDAGKILLRDYVNATIGFQKLSKMMNKKDASHKRMLGPSENPTAENQFAMTGLLQRQEGVKLRVIAKHR